MALSSGSTTPSDCYVSPCGQITLYLGDCRQVAPNLEPQSCHLFLADPPYGMGKEKDGVLNDNLYGPKLDAFLMECWTACRPALKNNASAYIWGEPESLWRLWYLGGLSTSERLTFRNEIIWRDPSGVSWGKDGMAGLRQYAPDGERALFFMLGEQGFNNNSDNYWEGWDSVLNYLKQEKDKTGWNIATFKRLAGHSEKSGCHWFDRSQWMMPTKAVYDSWQKEANGNAFKRDYDDLKREFYATRSYFDNTHQNMTDVWHFARVTGHERHGHATPKPVALMARSVKSSCPPNGCVLDPFMGTAPTAIACIRTGRKFIGIEKDPVHFAQAIKRVKTELSQGDLFLNQPMAA